MNHLEFGKIMIQSGSMLSILCAIAFGISNISEYKEILEMLNIIAFVGILISIIIISIGVIEINWVET